MTEKKACEFLHLGMSSGYTACTDCNFECPKRNCIDSFKGKQCKYAPVCLSTSGKTYANVEEFCHNNPLKTAQSVELINGNNNGTDLANIKGIEECCKQENEAYFCDTGNLYEVTPFYEICKADRFSNASFNGTIFEVYLSNAVCDSFKECLEDNTLVFPLCEFRGKFYEKRIDFCKHKRENWETTKVIDCSINSACISEFNCQAAYVSLQLDPVNYQILCNNYYIPLTTVPIASDYLSYPFTKPLFCSNGPCTLIDCLEKRHIELSPITVPVCHPKTYLLLNDLNAIATAITDDVTIGLDDFLTCTETCDQDACNEFKKANSIDTTFCESEFKTESGICGYLNNTSTYFSTVKEFCIAAVKSGITGPFFTEGWPAFDLDNTALTTDDECIELKKIKDCETALNYESWTKICARDVSVADHSSPTVSKLYPNELRYCEALIKNSFQPNYDAKAIDGSGFTTDNEYIDAQTKNKCASNNSKIAMPICKFDFDKQTASYFPTIADLCNDLVSKNIRSGFMDNTLVSAFFSNDSDCEQLLPLETCKKEIKYNTKVCGADPRDYVMRLFPSKLSFCNFTIGRGIKNSFTDYASNGYGKKLSVECYGGCLNNKWDSCNPQTGQLETAEKMCITKLSKDIIDSYDKCFSDEVQVNCRQSDCCSFDKKEEGALEPVCMDTGKYFRHKYIYCMHKSHFPKKKHDVHVLPKYVPICGSDFKLYPSGQSYCKAMSENKQLESLTCEGTCTRVTCCLKQCGSEFEPVIIKMFRDSLKVYQNECIAKCNDPRGEVMHSCDTSLSVDKCLIQYKSANTNCNSRNDSLVCAHDGQLYDSYCEAKSRGLGVWHVCSKSAKTDTTGEKRKKCFEYCQKKLDSYS